MIHSILLRLLNNFNREWSYHVRMVLKRYLLGSAAVCVVGTLSGTVTGTFFDVLLVVPLLAVLAIAIIAIATIGTTSNNRGIRNDCKNDPVPRPGPPTV